MKRALFWMLVVGGIGYYGYQKVAAPPAGTGPGAAPGQAIAGQDKNPAPSSDPYALLTSGQARAAAEGFEALIAKMEGKTVPELPKAVYHLGKAYLAMDNAVAASRQFQRVIDEFPRNEHAGNALVQLGRLEADPAKREALLLRAIETHPRAAEVGPVAYDLGRALLETGRELEGWSALTAALRAPQSADRAQGIRALLEPLVKKHLFSATPSPLATFYTVKSGDVLVKIARQHGVEVGLIQRANNLRTSNIYPNQRLKIVGGKWTIEVVVSQFRLTVFHEGRWVKDWSVGTGNPQESPTPIGDFTINSKLVNPPWKNIPFGDPRNILGTRWMGFEEMPSYGIHGTTQPDTVGKALSAGCVRMRNEDVEVLYDLVPMGSKGTVRE